MNAVWSQSRLATSLALAIWAVLFWYILLAERTSFYFASRTSWLVPVGAITLTVAMLGRVISSRVPHAEPVSPKQLGALVVLIAPAVLIMAFPPATLGSFAVSRRSSATIKGAYVSATDRDLSKGDLSLVDIFGLSYYGELDKLAPRAGTASSFTGFVTRSPTDGADEFQLNRFMISCCPGDAVSVHLRIVGAPSGQFEQDDWVRVTGRIYPIGKEVIVDASKVEPVRRPQRPYLNSG